MTRDELCARWATQRDSFARTGALVDGARIISAFLTDLASVDAASGVLTLAEAAKQSGYSVEHLARLIRQGRIRNAGRRHAPRIQVEDLPVRREVARTRTGSYDVNADARTLKNERQ